MSHRFKVNIFILTTFLALLTIPVMNYYRAGDDFEFSRKTLFNVDYFIPLIQEQVFPLGLSLDSEQVVIGKEGWLYLGDQYKENITTRRNGVSIAEVERAKDLQLGLAQWDSYFKSKGVRVFQVMMGPDKKTIYPEYLPDWAKPAVTTRTDALLSGEHSDLISDIRPSLITAKKEYENDLYYKTDTHWNSLGAWVAFSAFIKDVSVDKGLIEGDWLSNDQVSVSSVSPAEGGDLSNFLRLKIIDERPIMTLGKEINVTRIDFNTGEIKGDRGNPDVSPPTSPLLFKNPEALNSAKVLWLRDSFGGPITPYMSATFSETLQVHYNYVNSTSLVDLVESFKPDYIFITSVERELIDLNIGLSELPVQSGIERSNQVFGGGTETVRSGLNDIDIDGNEYIVTGFEDPYIVFNFQQPVDTTQNTTIAFSLNCSDRTEEIGLQLFWHKIGDSNFSENNSIRFSTVTGDVTVNLGMNRNWLEADRVGRLRVDLDSSSKCNQFSLSEPKVLF